MEKLDKKDKKILYELYKDARASNTQLAGRVGLSKEAIAYRLKRFERENILTKITTIVDYYKLGYKQFQLRIKLTSEGKIKKDEFIEEVKKIPQISTIIKITGQWDYTLQILVKTIQEFQELYDSVLNNIGNLIAKKSAALIFNEAHLSPTHLLESDTIEINGQVKEKTFDLDENQDKLINILEEDARESLVQIAKKMNVSISTIKYHLKLLEKNKIILAYKPIINLKTLGYETYRVLIDLQDNTKKKTIIQRLKMNPKITKITEYLGEHDIEFEGQYPNMNELLKELEEIEATVSINEYEILHNNEEILTRGIPEYKDENTSKENKKIKKG